jgi:tetratricopeptide (TPR) repeat protein
MTLYLLFLILGQTATIQGTVRDTNNVPLASVIISLQQEGSQASQSTRTDKNGSYRFDSVPDGTFLLRAEVAGFATKTSDPFRIGPQQTRTLDVTLQPAFFDEPQYTVAGVTDNTYRGGHGSDTVLRSSEALTKATASLSKDNDPKTPVDEAALLKLANSEPHSFSANYEFAKVLVANGKCKDALPYIQRALAADKLSAEAFHLLGDASERAGNPLDAVHAYQTAAKLQPTETNIFDLGTEMLTHLAPEAAIEVFTKGHDLFPRSTRILLGLAASLYSRGRYEDAAARFFEACDVNPANPEPYLFLGKVQRSEITHSDGFLTRMRRFSQLRPDNPWADYLYASAMKNDGNIHPEVKPLLEKAIKLDPRFAEAFLLLGAVQYDLKDLPAAIVDLQKATELDPAQAEAHYRLAQIYKVQGRSLDAKYELELYEQLSEQNARKVEQQRSETQRFVVALRSQSQ